MASVSTGAESPPNEDVDRRRGGRDRSTTGSSADTHGDERRRGPGGLDPEARQQLMDTDIEPVNQTAAENGNGERLAQGAAEAARLEETAKEQQSSEAVTSNEDEGISMDFDKEPAAIPTHGSTGGLFPGVTCTTVALLQTRTGRKYINRYGPPTCPWFVIGDSSYGLPISDGEKEDDLLDSKGYQCVSDPNYRVLDYPYKQIEKDKKPKKEDVKGILCVVSDLPLEVQGSPMEMINHLNPSIVKRSDEFKDLKSRQRASKDGTKLDKYPSTYLFLEFKKDVRPENEFRRDRSWELSSKFRALHGTKGQISTEQVIYQTARNRAHRFLAWYKARHPEDFKQFEDQARSIVALERTPSKSPQPVPVSDVTIKKEPRDAEEETADVLNSSVPERTTGEVVSEGPQPVPISIQESDEDVQLTEAERKEEAEKVWRMQSSVPMSRTLTAKEKARFNTFYRLAKSNGLV
ncbi:hypothetical protein OHC33_005284 [Knufia fluminis]|uniref:Uncharacterized protein n=1 Tax=Knufia fluminis TaxID=191047 RepID=A0AAN8EM61_9EURO|nr:hypothetical protein OHC33_005284 [Knufia fluminis]